MAPRQRLQPLWQRNSSWHCGGGTLAALWKSTDGGNTWTKLDGPGWPKPKDGMYERIAIAIFRAKSTTIYAQVSTMNVTLKAGLNTFQWNMRGPVQAGQQNARGGGGGGRNGPPDLVPDDPNAPWTPPGTARPERSTEVPFAAAGGRGGGGGGGGGGGFGAAPLGPLVEPGTYMVKLTTGDHTVMSSVDVLDDVWMRPQ
jgi:hypothetical protein